MTDPILDIQKLSVEFQNAGEWSAVTHEIDLAIYPGETVALVGESGSGKSVTAMSILDLLPKNARRSGKVMFEGKDLLKTPEPAMRKLRGSDVATIFQEPMTALNPVYTVGEQLREAIQSHRSISNAKADSLALELLNKVKMPTPSSKLGHYPNQLSGGQRQRAMIAMAISSEPKLLIADEPTTALDVTVQAEILDLLVDLQARMHMALLIITHDMGVVADVAHRVVVMHNGRLVEEADTEKLFNDPQANYTRELLDAVPYLGRTVKTQPDPVAESEEDLSQDNPSAALEFKGVNVEYGGSFRRAGFLAVNDVSLHVDQGEIVGLVGESGSGKSTIGRASIGLLDISRGNIRIDGMEISGTGRSMRELRQKVSMVFQDPGSSLNPKASIGRSISDPIRWTGIQMSRRDREARVKKLLDQVQINPGWATRYPHELSGGQRQRVAIARAIATNPKLMIADEPTSALDVSVQKKVLELLLELQRELGFSCLFISHDLAVIESLANRVVVLNQGKIVETGYTRKVLAQPSEDYTQRLMAAAPVPDPAVQQQRRKQRLHLSS